MSENKTPEIKATKKYTKPMTNWKEGTTKKGNKKYSKIIDGKWCNIVITKDKNGDNTSYVIYDDDITPFEEITETNKTALFAVLERILIKKNQENKI